MKTGAAERMIKCLALTVLSSFFCRRALAEPSSEFIRKNALKIESAGDLSDQMYAKIKGYQVITVGEVHGTNEAPAFVLRLLKLLAKKGRSPLLGLEILTDVQGTVDSFLKTGKIEVLKDSAFFKRDIQEGRSSSAMADLLAGARALRGLRVVCFDPTDPTDWQDRDTKMARNISAAFSKQGKGVAVILAGNAHTAIEKGSFRDKNYRPMAYELYAGDGAIFSKNDILAIRIRFGSGSAWTWKGDVCAAADFPQNGDGYTTALSWPSYFLKEDEISEGHNATFFIRTISASVPLKLAGMKGSLGVSLPCK